MARTAGGCTLKKTNTAVVVGIYGEGVPHGKQSPSCLWGEYMADTSSHSTYDAVPCQVPVQGFADAGCSPQHSALLLPVVFLQETAMWWWRTWQTT